MFNTTFQIKEEQLCHLLGVNIKQLQRNPDFQRLTGRKEMGSIEILEWILTDIDGNNDLMQYSYDFIQKILQSKDFKVNEFQRNDTTATQLLNYYKIRSKSQTFLKYGPFKKTSLVAKLGRDESGQQKTLSGNSNSTAAMISRAETFRKYPWAYFGLVNNSKDQYIETLQIDSAENKKNLFKNSKPAIVKSFTDGSETNNGSQGSDGSQYGYKAFSEEEQFELFFQAYQDFKNTMDFNDLIEYFNNLNKSYTKQQTSNINDNETRGKRR